MLLFNIEARHLIGTGFNGTKPFGRIKASRDEELGFLHRFSVQKFEIKKKLIKRSQLAELLLAEICRF